MSRDGIETIDRDRDTALPRSNGELVFEAPWHSRAFGLAVALHERGVLDFEEFRADLVAEVQAWQGAHDQADPRWAYYERWQAALERALARRGLVSTTELDTRAATLAHAWSHSHDH
jgi:nitrile hydratase accessory protein